MPITSPMGLLALLALVPLIIIYWLRPRPRELRVPTLQFFRESEELKSISVVSRIIRDPLFYLNALLIILVAVALAGPTIMASTAAPTAIVIDSSASMQAGGFSEAIEIARDSLGEENTIILAGNVPVEVVRDASPQRAEEALDKINPGATQADLSAAMRLAHTIDEDARLLVISDFLGYRGEPPEKTADLLEEGGMDVRLATVGGTSDNIGIVDGWTERRNGAYDYRFTVKNYGAPATITATAESKGETLLSREVSLERGGSKSLRLENLPSGITKIQINPGGSLQADDIAYVSLPGGPTARALYLGESGPITIALRAAGVNVTTSDSLPEKLSYHFIVSPRPIPPERARDYLARGGSIVYVASEDLLGAQGLPVRAIDVLNQTNVRHVERSRVTRDIGFTRVTLDQYLRTTPAEGATTLVRAEDDSPLLAYKSVERGRVVYLGFNPEWSDFHMRRDYPVFWQQMSSWLTGRASIRELNKHAGDREILTEKQTIKTPTGEVEASYVYYSEAGLYEVKDRRVAVNMYNPAESDLRTQSPPTRHTTFNLGEHTREAPVSLQYIPILLILPLVVLELVVLWRRGDV